MARKRGNPFHKDTPFGGARAVDDSAELRRIAALPRRKWEDAYPEVPPMPAEVRAWMYRAITLKATDEQILGVYPQVRPYLHVLRLEAWLRQQNGKQALRPIQVAALFEMYYNRGLLLSASVGAGKTLTSLLAFLVLEARRPLLLLPAKLIDKTHREAAKYRVDWLIPRVRMESYEKLGRTQNAKMLDEAQPDVLVCDECFPGSTLVHTDAGQVPIARVVDEGVGKHVLAAGESGLHWRKIVRRVKKESHKRLVRVHHTHGTLTCTEDHKIWTERGYVRALCLLRGDHLRRVREASTGRAEGEANPHTLHAGLRLQGHSEQTRGETAQEWTTSTSSGDGLPEVRQNDPRLGVVAEEQTAQVLQHVLLVGGAPSTVRRNSAEAKHSDIQSAQGETATVAFREDAFEQPHQGPPGVGQNEQSLEREDVLGEGRQRATDRPAEDAARSAERALPYGVSDLHEGRDRAQSTHVLQGGSGGCGAAHSDRDRRRIAQIAQVEVPGQTQDWHLEPARVARVEILEQTSADGPEGCGAAGAWVYDLEVDTDHNYFADNTLVSNCHRLRNPAAAVTKRVKRYLEGNENVVFVGMSGTIMKRSILDFSHMLRWALRPTRAADGTRIAKSPLPVTFEDGITWSMALDQKRDDEGRTAPGALVQFCTPEEREHLSRVAYDEGLGVVRRAVMRRVMETPGVVATTSPMIGASLRVENIRLMLESVASIEAIRGLRERWDRPDGEPLLDAIELWRHMRSVGLGFYYRWNPAPPHVWREKRTAWSSYMRTILKTNRSHLDSPKQVMDAIDAGLYDSEPLKQWREVQGLYDPEKNREAVWLDSAALDFCARWMKGEAEEVPKDTQGGIVWVEHTEFGHELARRTGVPYYGQGGIDAITKRFIEQHPPKQPMIASIASNSEGRNLQAWSTNLITSVPPNGKQMEQLLGRTHREGQEADEVVYQFITTVQEQLDSFWRACSDARALTDMTGQPQKLTYCDIVIDEFGGSIKKHKKA